MKAAPFPFVEFQGKGLLDFSSSSTSTSSSSLLDHSKWNNNPKSITTTAISKGKGKFYAGSDLSSAATETTTTTAARSPSPSQAAASSSTLSSSLNSGGGGGSTATTQDITGGTNPGKCGMGVEDWEAVFPETGGPVSPGQEQSILRLIMGDIEDPSVGLSKLLQGGGGSHHDMEFSGGFGLMDHQIQGFSFEQVSMGSANLLSSNSVEPCLNDLPLGAIHSSGNSNSNRQVSPFPLFPDSVSNNNVMPFALPPGMIQQQQQAHNTESLDEKPQIFHSQMIMNQNQVHFPQNPSLLVPPGLYQIQEHPLPSSSPPSLKRLNSGAIGSNFASPRANLANSSLEMFGRRQLESHSPQQFQARPAAMVMKQKNAADELANHHLQQAIIDQLCKAVELIETGNLVLAQGILARLNQLSPIGKPFHRAAFYFKEALQLLLHTGSTNPSSIPISPFSLIYKIGAYKSFCEISPVVQFANFTCNQAFLEALDGYGRVHILSFDVGYGGEWAALMQELALRNGGPPSLKITAFASPSTHDELELTLTQENLKHFASELNMALEFEVVNIDSLNSASWQLPVHVLDGEAIAVSLPISSFANYPSHLPAALRFIKQLSPKIVVSLDRSCDRTDTPFPNHAIHALQSYSSLLESLDAVNVNFDVLQKIERYLIQPSIEKIVTGRHRSPEKTLAWRSLFLSSGFSPLTFSNFNESQAECLVQRSIVRGFHVEKRQSSLVLCWNRKELISASAWRC